MFATTGPGLLNALTGMTAGRWDGAKVILVSGSTNHAQRGRWATQETSSYTLPQDGEDKAVELGAVIWVHFEEWTGQ